MRIRRPPFARAVGIAFMLLAFATTGGLALNAQESTRMLEKSQHVACQKANALVVESNQRIRSHLVMREAAEDALKSTAIARRASYKMTGQQADKVAAERAEALLDKIEHEVKFNQTPRVNCDSLVPQDTNLFGF